MLPHRKLGEVHSSAADRALMLSVMISAYRISDGGFRGNAL